MFTRLLAPALLSASTQFPAIALTGPRQSGKTTLLKYLFPQYKYVNLEDPETLLQAQDDPKAFLNRNTSGIIIDEAQNYPDLFSHLQILIDSKQLAPCILSGSQNFYLSEKISQTLAGRIAIFELLPLSYKEFKSDANMPDLDLWHYLYHGSYPRPYHEKLDFAIWYNSYIRTYLERDVRNMTQIKDLAKFQLFLKLCAGRHGQLLNLSSLANDCGISHTTAGQWISLLEASYIIFRLQPHYKNFNKRLIKTAKLYFFDTGILCRLLGIESAEHLQTHASRGAIFEGFIITEYYKQFINQCKIPSLYFWQDQKGDEVDLIIEKGLDLFPIEIKSGSTFNADYVKGLLRFEAMSGQHEGKLIYTGEQAFPYKGFDIIPWQEAILHNEC